VHVGGERVVLQVACGSHFSQPSGLVSASESPHPAKEQRAEMTATPRSRVQRNDHREPGLAGERRLVTILIAYRKSTKQRSLVD
jgi:hypothetical protein